MGRLEGDEVVCGYHGMVFDGEGRCTHMPSQETVNPSACVRTYPVVQKHRFIWVWPGDPSLADESTVPDLHWNDDREWAADGKLITVQCDYRLVVDIAVAQAIAECDKHRKVAEAAAKRLGERETRVALVRDKLATEQGQIALAREELTRQRQGGLHHRRRAGRQSRGARGKAPSLRDPSRR